MAALLKGQLELEQFEDWIEEATWELHRSASRGAVELVSSLQLLLSEHEDGVRSHDDLFEEIAKLLSRVDDSIALPALAGNWEDSHRTPVFRSADLSLHETWTAQPA